MECEGLTEHLLWQRSNTRNTGQNQEQIHRPSGILRRASHKIQHINIMDLKDGVHGRFITPRQCTREAHNGPQVVQNGPIQEANVIKYKRWRNIHLIQIKIPGQKPTIPVGSNK